MKNQTIALLFILCAMRLTAQKLPTELNKLDGNWHCKTCQHKVRSEWVFVNDALVQNRIYMLNGTDTVDISRTEIRADLAGETMLTYTRKGLPTKIFRLSDNQTNGLRWENTNPKDFPTCIKLEFYCATGYMFRGFMEDLEFRHDRGRLRLFGVLAIIVAKMRIKPYFLKK